MVLNTVCLKCTVYCSWGGPCLVSVSTCITHQSLYFLSLLFIVVWHSGVWIYQSRFLVWYWKALDSCHFMAVKRQDSVSYLARTSWWLWIVFHLLVYLEVECLLCIRFSVENLESKQVRWLVPVTSAFGRQRRADYQFQRSDSGLGSLVTLFQNQMDFLCKVCACTA